MQLKNNTKYIWLMGGLGNVLFQILQGDIANKNEQSIKYIDFLTKESLITRLSGWSIHDSLFDLFINQDEIEEMPSYKAFYFILFAFLTKKYYKDNRLVKFHNSSFSSGNLSAKHNFGYFQNKLLISKNIDSLRILTACIRSKFSIKDSRTVVHFRYGDSKLAKLDDRYYKQVKERIKLESENVLICTDDIEHAIVFFRDCVNVEFSKNKSSIDDFAHMVSAKKLYCSNSTFSWWAAHSLSSESIIVAPLSLYNLYGIYSQKNKLIVIE